ncbi:MAG: PPOX class F420-dependent oxidoreductase [Acidobacteriota bacterium]|nr:PPOX class F420-dependent oxidoreductase [Acidobacteriota bacterium]
MANSVPESYLDLVTNKKVFAHLATLMPDGSPQVTPVWFDLEGDRIRVNSAKGRQKDRNMRRDPRVSICLMDPENPYRYVELRGRVVEITEEGADAHIDSLGFKYLDAESYPFRKKDEIRVIYKIEIEHAQGLR